MLVIIALATEVAKDAFAELTETAAERDLAELPLVKVDSFDLACTDGMLAAAMKAPVGEVKLGTFGVGLLAPNR